MKYSAAILALAMGVFAVPQEASSITSAPATTSAPSNLTPQQSCAIACDATDLNCRASCVGVARPNASQAVETTECAAQCEQGDGSPADTQKYSDCVQSCIASLFPSSQTVSLANGAAGSSSAAATGSGATGSSNTASVTGSSSQSTGSSPQSTGAANSNSAHYAGAGLAGLLAALAF